MPAGFPEPRLQTGRIFPAPTGGFIEFLDAGAKPARLFGEIYNQLKKPTRFPGALGFGEGFGKPISARENTSLEFRRMGREGFYFSRRQ
jgi:hypothetical protein